MPLVIPVGHNRQRHRLPHREILVEESKLFFRAWEGSKLQAWGECVCGTWIDSLAAALGAASSSAQTIGISRPEDPGTLSLPESLIRLKAVELLQRAEDMLVRAAGEAWAWDGQMGWTPLD